MRGTDAEEIQRECDKALLAGVNAQTIAAARRRIQQLKQAAGEELISTAIAAARQRAQRVREAAMVATNQQETTKGKDSSLVSAFVWQALQTSQPSDGDVAQAASTSMCSICLEQPKLEEEFCILPCMHIFHCDCVDSWIRAKRTCPNCRIRADVDIQDRTGVPRNEHGT